MKVVFCIYLLFFYSLAHALVAGPDSTVIEGEHVINYGLQNESGLAKPLETANSWIDSKIVTHKLSYSQGLGDKEGYGFEHILGVAVSLEDSGVEEKNGTIFYEKAQTKTVALQYSLKPVAETDYSLTAYTSVLLVFDGKKEKFVQGRNDQVQLGLRSSTRLGEKGIFESWLHYGSGFSGSQNSYIASSFSFGYRFGQAGKIEPSFRFGPYFEFDLDTRRDLKYENAFGSGHPSESIRQIKIADAVYFDLAVHRKYLLSLVSVRKRAGEDLRSTEAYSLQLSVKY